MHILQHRDTSDKPEVKVNYSNALVLPKLNERDLAADILNEQVDTRDSGVRPKQKSSDSIKPILSTAKGVDPIITIDDSNPLMIANSLKDIQVPQQIELSNRGMRQKEIRLKKQEDGIKISKKDTEEYIKDNARLKSYSLKLEAQVKELDNSNKILRMKVTGNNPDRPVSNGTEEKVPLQTINHNQQIHPVYHHSPCCQQQPSPQTAFQLLEMNSLKDNIRHIEETRQLNERIQELAINNINHRITALETSQQYMGYIQQQYRPPYYIRRPEHPWYYHRPTSIQQPYGFQHPPHIRPPPPIYNHIPTYGQNFAEN
ncbi:unnamed protein product [Mytilus edulis]|uniref:Uncharacterized protein n=1 Tax=Mytilus edulis TaxID=6550 RepID=A0A8S3PY22_MYTED|nr:unnamed protein product [Mytilus edulis]